MSPTLPTNIQKEEVNINIGTQQSPSEAPPQYIFW